MSDPSTEPRRRRVRLLGWAIGALPLAFGLARAVKTGDDLRYLWTAAASLAGAAAVMVLGKARTRPPRLVLQLSLIALLTATVGGALAARLLGARSAGAVWFVALGFGICSAAGFALAIRGT